MINAFICILIFDIIASPIVMNKILWILLHLYICLLFQLALVEDHFEPSVEVVMPYVLGQYLKQGGLPWHEARTVYAIANINNNHCVCVEISLEEQSLTVYNSIKSTIDWKNPPACLVNATNFVPWICLHKGIWEKRKTYIPIRSVWRHVEHRNTPQQQNGSDCGIMSMKMIECLASGHSVDELDWERFAVYRSTYCGQLFDYGKKCKDLDFWSLILCYFILIVYGAIFVKMWGNCR